MKKLDFKTEMLLRNIHGRFDDLHERIERCDSLLEKAEKLREKIEKEMKHEVHC